MTEIGLFNSHPASGGVGQTRRDADDAAEPCVDFAELLSFAGTVPAVVVPVQQEANPAAAAQSSSSDPAFENTPRGCVLAPVLTTKHAGTEVLHAPSSPSAPSDLPSASADTPAYADTLTRAGSDTNIAPVISPPLDAPAPQSFPPTPLVTRVEAAERDLVNTGKDIQDAGKDVTATGKDIAGTGKGIADVVEEIPLDVASQARLARTHVTQGPTTQGHVMQGHVMQGQAAQGMTARALSSSSAPASNAKGEVFEVNFDDFANVHPARAALTETLDPGIDFGAKSSRDPLAHAAEIVSALRGRAPRGDRSRDGFDHAGGPLMFDPPHVETASARHAWSEPKVAREAVEHLAGELAVAAGEAVVHGAPRTIRVRLRPEELGSVEVNVQAEAGGRLCASFTAEQETTRQALSENLTTLRDALERAGVSFERIDIAAGHSGSSGGAGTRDGPRADGGAARDSAQHAEARSSRASHTAGVDETPHAERLLSVRA